MKTTGQKIIEVWMDWNGMPSPELMGHQQEQERMAQAFRVTDAYV